MTENAKDRCPYSIGLRRCTAGDRGHAGPHVWPLLCDRRHLGYRCTETRGHEGLHRARSAAYLLMHSWETRARKVARR